jgi:hypothetical protein
MADPRIKLSISLPVEVQARIEARRGDNPTSAQIAADLASYWSVLDLGMREARSLLTAAEASVILDVQNAAWVDPSSLSVWLSGGLAHQVSDGCALDGLATKWDCDGSALSEKLRNASPLVITSLLDWAQTFWRGDKKSVKKATEEFRGAK